MTTSAKKVAANRINGQKSHGPTDTTSTRFNATKHGLLAKGITELDDAEGYRTILSNLREEKAPVGILETVLVESIALDMVRLLRARRLEAEYITAVLNPPIHGMGLLAEDILVQGLMLDPGLPAAIGAESGQCLVNIFQRYESTVLLRFLRLFRELEWLQRTRNGKTLPEPAVVDVSIHAATPDLPVALDNSADTKIMEQSNSLRADEHGNTSGESGRSDSVPATIEQPNGLSGIPEENVRATGILNPRPEPSAEEPKAIGPGEPARIRNEPN